MEATKEYNVHLDNKKRVTLRGALYQYYNVKEYENGCIMLEPRELTVPDTISARTLKDMDKAISNYKQGYVSDPIDLSDFEQCEHMSFIIRMGLPEMEELWNKLQTEYRVGTISKNDAIIFKKWGKALKLLSENPRHPSLRTHDIEALSERYGERVWQSYLENKTSGAMRMYWVYGPDQKSITIIGLEPHPEDKKNGAYERIILSDLPLMKKDES